MRVSIVICLYNKEPFVAQSIESALNQSYFNTEVIIVDDGSIDKSADIARQYLNRIRLITQSNQGLAKSRNVGFEIATGDFLFPLDSDDWLEKDAIAKMLPLMEDKKVGIVSCDVVLSGSASGIERCKHASLEGMMQENQLPGSSLIRREAFWGVGGYSDIYYEDWDLALKIIKAGWKTKVLHEGLFHYRITPGSILTRPDRPSHEDCVKQLKKLHPDLWNSE